MLSQINKTDHFYHDFIVNSKIIFLADLYIFLFLPN